MQKLAFLLPFDYILVHNVGGQGSQMPSSTLFLYPAWELFVCLGLMPTQQNVRKQGVNKDTGGARGNSDDIKAPKGS